MHEEDADVRELDERMAISKKFAHLRSLEEAFPYLRIPQSTVAEKPQVSRVHSTSPTLREKPRSSSQESGRERRGGKKGKHVELPSNSVQVRQYPWLSTEAETRLLEIERKISSKLQITRSASKLQPAKILKLSSVQIASHKKRQMVSELNRLWGVMHLGKIINYLQFISLLTELGVIEGSEIKLINRLWTTIKGDENQGAKKEAVRELLETLEIESKGSLNPQDETRCTDDSINLISDYRKPDFDERLKPKRQQRMT